MQIATPILIWLIKLSLYSLIFHAFNPLTYVRWMVYAGVIVSFCFYLTAAVVNGVTCRPKGGTDRLAYLAGLAAQGCDDLFRPVQIINIALGGVNLVNDFYLLILPIPAIVKLKLPLRKKISIMFIFMTGAGYGY